MTHWPADYVNHGTRLGAVYLFFLDQSTRGSVWQKYFNTLWLVLPGLSCLTASLHEGRLWPLRACSAKTKPSVQSGSKLRSQMSRA